MSYNYYRHELCVIKNLIHPRLKWKQNIKRLLDIYTVDTIAGCLEKSYIGLENISEDDIKRHLSSEAKDKAQRCPFYVGATYDCGALCLKNGGCRYAFCSGYLKNCRRPN